MGRKKAPPKTHLVLYRLNWQACGKGKARLPGKTRLRSFGVADEAEEEARRLGLDSPTWKTFSRKLGHGTYIDWHACRDALAPELNDEQRDGVFDLLDRLTCYEVAEVEEGVTAMSKPLAHARSSARRWGGRPVDDLAIHEKMDSTKMVHAEVTHRAVFHSAFGIYLVQELCGRTLTNADGKEVHLRDVAEQHVLEDLGFIPSLSD